MPLPAWMGAVDKLKPAAALGAGAVLAAANPKNLLLAVAGAAAIAQTGIAGGQQALAYLVFAVIATIGAAIPVIIYFAMGKRSESPWLHTFPQFSGRISVTARRFRDHLTVG